MRQKGDNMTENPYKAGSPCYLAWEFGYMQALDDVKALDNVQTEVGQCTNLIMCKDCDHCEKRIISKDLMWCGLHMIGVRESHFCADGKRA